MNKTLSGKIVVITGGATGIGFGCAKLFAQNGCRVGIMSRTETELKRAVHEISEVSSEADVFYEVADVARESDVMRAINSFGKKMGGIDFLVNNAGVVIKNSLSEVSNEEWDSVIDINVKGPWLCSKAVLPWMKKKGEGAIVNIGSLAGIRGTNKFPGFGTYTTSKFAVVGLTEALAVDFKVFGIRVNCVAPGAVDTEMLRRVAPDLKPGAKPSDIAETVMFLCDRARSKTMTGSTIEIFTNL